jgi:hypothetical protein
MTMMMIRVTGMKMKTMKTMIVTAAAMRTLGTSMVRIISYTDQGKKSRKNQYSTQIPPIQKPL